MPKAKAPAKRAAEAEEPADEAAAATASPAKKQKAAAKTKKPRAKKVKPDPVTEKDPPELAAAATSAAPRMKIISWNVDGLRAQGRREVLAKIVEEHAPDLLFLQETKLQVGHVKDFENCLPGYSDFWSCCTVKRGTSCSYAGTAVFVKEGLGAKEANEAAAPAGKAKKSIASFFTKKPAAGAAAAAPAAGAVVSYEIGPGAYFGRDEGRAITVELPNLFAVGLYVPNAGMKLENLSTRTEDWDPALRKYISSLQAKGKPVVVTGDLNVAHRDGDVYNYFAPHLKKTPGCTMAERDSFSLMLDELKMQDAFRSQHGDARGWYTYWSVRTGARPVNKGLRLDYFVCSESMFDGDAATASVAGCSNLDAISVGVSDHCPVALDVALGAAP